MQYRKSLISGMCACLLSGLSAVSHAQYAYDIVSLGNIGPSDYPYALNNQGQVVGVYYSPQDQHGHAFLYSNGQISDLSPTGIDSDLGVVGINDRGQVTGTGANGTLVYDLNTKATQIITTNKFDRTYAINQNGDVSGSYKTATGATHAFIYSSNTGNFQDISNMLGGFSEAFALNNTGQAVGTAVIGSEEHAFLYSNGVMQDIGALPGGTVSFAKGINDSGEVVGYSDATGVSTSHAFLYRNGQMQDLGTLYPNDFDSIAYGINNAGDIIGTSGYNAFLYHNGQMLDLNSLIDPSLGWNIGEAYAINDRGQIVGVGSQGMFLMTPHIANTPAPGSLVVAVVGVGLLAGRRRRRSR